MEIVDPRHPGVAWLEAGLDAEYRRLYGDTTAGEMEAYGPAEFQPPTGAIVLIVEGDETVAGGALRRWADGIGEIKRMWTAPMHRRRGHARRVLRALEEIAREYGYRSVRLETGVYQAAAISLYLETGYQPLDNYGRYADSPLAVSFEKRLASA
jgi:ribosomal protein S18 acetylase RimI-like enzyme